MRIVAVTHCHPATPHVCATRAREFARALARRGHKVVLLTETLAEQSKQTISPGHLGQLLNGHDWREPFFLACLPIPMPFLEAAREGRMKRWFRRPLIAAVYLIRGGLFLDWREGSRPYWVPLAKAFRPDAVWAIFGNTDAMIIGRAIAKQARCPWILDMKDPWSTFIPFALRRLLAIRLSGFRAATALSEYHAADLKQCFGRNATIVRSGIALPAPPRSATSPTPSVLVLGALYGESDLRSLLEGIRIWLNALSPDQRTQARVYYAGSEGARFHDAAHGAGLSTAVETVGYVTVEALAILAARCVAVLYVRSRRAGYQHKLIELAGFGRPAICLPAESAEALDLMSRLGGSLVGCETPPDVAAALDVALHHPPASASREALSEFTWDNQAERLLETLSRANEISE